MTKKEFLEQLRLALIGEIPDREIISQLDYYSKYIEKESQYRKEEEIISEIGSPHLIAKTVIDAYERAYGSSYKKQRGGNRHIKWDSSGYASSSHNDPKYSNYEDPYSDNHKKNFDYKREVPGTIKLILILFIVLGFVLIVFLGRVIFSLLRYLLPIIIIVGLILFVFSLIKKE